MGMARQGDTTRCFKIKCNGTMTYHQKLKIDLEADQKVQPSGSVGVRKDPDYAGWLCDTCGEAFWDNP